MWNNGFRRNELIPALSKERCFLFCPRFFYFENCEQKWPQKFVGQFLIKCCWDKKYLQKKSFSLSQAQSCLKNVLKMFLTFKTNSCVYYCILMKIRYLKRQKSIS
jgi:hypothetical protein